MSTYPQRLENIIYGDVAFHTRILYFKNCFQYKCDKACQSFSSIDMIFLNGFLTKWNQFF